MAKKSIIITSLFLISILYFLFSIFHFQIPSPSYAVLLINGGGGGKPPPPPPPPTIAYPNPTSTVSQINVRCPKSDGTETDECKPCNAIPQGCYVPVGAQCGECGGGGGGCTGGCVQSHEECGWVTCAEEDCARGECSWNVDHTWCRSWECTTVCDRWVPAGSCVSACVNGSCTDSCGNVLPCGSPPSATMTCPSSPVNVGDTVTFKVNATDQDGNLYSAGIYFSPTDSQNWKRLNNDATLGTDLTPNIGLSGSSRTITATWNPTAADANKTFYVVPQIYDSSGKKCTSNPWGNPAGFVNCSSPPENSRCTIQVLGYPNCRDLNAPAIALVGDTISITATYEKGSAPAVTDAGITILSNSSDCGSIVSNNPSNQAVSSSPQDELEGEDLSGFQKPDRSDSEFPRFDDPCAQNAR